MTNHADPALPDDSLSDAPSKTSVPTAAATSAVTDAAASASTGATDAANEVATQHEDRQHMTTRETNDTIDNDALLAGYLRDHLAGAAAGLALAQRCRRANDGTPLGQVMADIEHEIADDREALVQIMDRLGVTENVVKSVVAKGAELLGRLKSNGTLTRYSPSSRVIELEGLLAGIDGKRNLWSSLRLVAADRPELDRAALDVLHDRADSQHQRLTIEHDRAAATAFTATTA